MPYYFMMHLPNKNGSHLEFDFADHAKIITELMGKGKNPALSMANHIEFYLDEDRIGLTLHPGSGFVMGWTDKDSRDLLYMKLCDIYKAQFIPQGEADKILENLNFENKREKKELIRELMSVDRSLSVVVNVFCKVGEQFASEEVVNATYNRMAEADDWQDLLLCGSLDSRIPKSGGQRIHVVAIIRGFRRNPFQAPWRTSGPGWNVISVQAAGLCDEDDE